MHPAVASSGRGEVQGRGHGGRSRKAAFWKIGVPATLPTPVTRKRECSAEATVTAPVPIRSLARQTG
jgi:hypothetical protein